MRGTFIILVEVRGRTIQEFKVILHYKTNLRPAWDRRDCFKKNEKQTNKQKPKR